MPSSPATPPIAIPSAARPLALAWLAGFFTTALPVAWAFAGLDVGPGAGLLVVGVLGMLVPLLALAARTGPSGARAALGAGAGAGVLAGVLLAQPTPTCWLMSDIAWHAAKIDLVARGRLLEDPILRAPTIYPFAWHLALAAPVALGASVKAVLWCASPLFLALGAWSFFALL